MRPLHSLRQSDMPSPSFRRKPESIFRLCLWPFARPCSLPTGEEPPPKPSWRNGSKPRRRLSPGKPTPPTPPCQGGKKKQNPLSPAGRIAFSSAPGRRASPFFAPLTRGGRGGCLYLLKRGLFQRLLLQPAAPSFLSRVKLSFLSRLRPLGPLRPYAS